MKSIKFRHAIIIFVILLIVAISGFCVWIATGDLFSAVTDKTSLRTRILLSLGADPNVYTSCMNSNDYCIEETPLNRVIRNGAFSSSSIDILNVLIDYHADVNADIKVYDEHRVIDQYNPLYEAVIRKDKEAVRILLNAGANVDVIKKSFGSPLSENKVEATLEYTPLIALFEITIGEIDPEIVKILINAGADVNSRFKAVVNGSVQMDHTALMYAVFLKKSPEIVKLLIEAGADVNFMLGKKTALDYYDEFDGESSVGEILIKAGAKHGKELQSNDKAQPQADDIIDFKSDKMPEFRKTVTNTEKDWGVIERTTLHVHDDIEIYYETPILKGDSPTFKKINDLMISKRDKFFSKEDIKFVWETEVERHGENEASKKLDTLYDYHTVSSVEIKDNYIGINIENHTWLNPDRSDNHNYSMSHYYFDLSGDPLKLSAIYHKSDDEIREMIISSLKEQIKDDPEQPELNECIDWEYLSHYDNYDSHLFMTSDGVPGINLEWTNDCWTLVGEGLEVIFLPKP